MTWEQLLEKVRDGLRESGASIHHATDVVGGAAERGDGLDKAEADMVRVLLILAVSNMHSVVEHLGIGLDAVVETLREANKSQEVKRE